MTTSEPAPTFTLVHEPTRVRALFEGHDIADSDDVIALREAGHPPVYYFPRKHVFMVFLSQTDKVTHDPDKGDARYFTIYRDQHIVDNVAWSYEAPNAPFAAIADRVAFSPAHVEFQVHGRSAADTEAEDRDVDIG
ncbi:DUF427 domain-containing protein [Caulobacter soli]|uniref:DUF427 domain-containing protein n=1 Tax=Caulobacter soli TaxID=2708539 RepID=UPI0013EB7ACC|nr:DUF427 domain-containing protein [Caulobacter soli]